MFCNAPELRMGGALSQDPRSFGFPTFCPGDDGLCVSSGPGAVDPQGHLYTCPVGGKIEEERSLSEIIKAFNDRHGTAFTREDFIRFEQVNREIMDDNLTEMLRNNPPDVVFSAFSEAFFKDAIKMFQRDNEMRSIVLSDTEARDQATRHFFNRALREVRESVQQ